MKYIKKIYELFLDPEQDRPYLNDMDPEIKNRRNISDAEVNLIMQAEKILGKKVGLMNRKTLMKEISDFIEANIPNKEMSKTIDILINIKSGLKRLEETNQ